MRMKRYLVSMTVLCCTSFLFAQGELDVYKYSQNEIKGTARYMGMGGAFGALGGDISTLSQNPAGIGVYRSSEVATTLSLNGISTQTNNRSFGESKDHNFRFSFDNIGYVGTFNTGNSSGLVNFNVGFAYNRQRSFNRTYKAGYNDLRSSLTNYIAEKTNAASAGSPIFPGDMEYNDKTGYNPYYDSGAPWLSVLGWNSYLINEVKQGERTAYEGFLRSGDMANADLYVKERGHIDEYSFNLGGNISDVFYWGAALGIVDINYDLYSGYVEYFNYADDTPVGGRANGNFDLQNSLSTSGTGFNFKMGVIAKPVSFLRLGLAFHTPTFYNMTDRYSARVDYNTLGFSGNNGSFSPNSGYAETYPAGVTDYNIRTPWKVMASAAAIIGKSAILSFDYEYMNYNKMQVSDDYGTLPGNDYISEDFKGGHTFKVGGEFRITRQFSARLGYANQLSPIKAHILDGSTEMLTAGTTPQYTLNRGTQYYTVGLGYRFGNFYLDGAFVYKQNKEDLLPFSPLFLNDGTQDIFPEKSTLKTNTKSFLLTVGYKF